MKRKSPYFFNLLIFYGIAFLITGFSLIYCVLNGSNIPEDQHIEHSLGFIYLILHFIIIAFFFFFTFKAYIGKSSLIQIIMTNEDGSKNKKSYRNAIIFTSIFGVILLYFLLLICGVKMPLIFFSLGLKFAILNLSLLISGTALFLVFYKPISKK